MVRLTAKKKNYQNVDPQRWFKVMDNVEDLYNHKTHSGNKHNRNTITGANGEIGNISLLTECHFNEEILNQ